MKKFIHSFKYALKGILYVLKKERNIRIQIIIGILVFILALILDISHIEFLIIIIISFFVIIMELLNTAIEKFLDTLSTEYNKNFGLIKDIMAGVVLTSTLLSIIIGILIYYKYIILFINNNF